LSALVAEPTPDSPVGETALTADTAMRLARFFGNTPEFWMNLQRA
jgi:addiction module HigA family antidote